MHLKIPVAHPDTSYVANISCINKYCSLVSNHPIKLVFLCLSLSKSHLFKQCIIMIDMFVMLILEHKSPMEKWLSKNDTLRYI